MNSREVQQVIQRQSDIVIGPDSMTPEPPAGEELKSPPPTLDPRFARSYFFLPFYDDEFFVRSKAAKSAPRPKHDKVVDQIVEYIQSSRATAPVTDLVVLAHGWHRNLFSSMAAYDRLTSLYLDMRARDQLDAPQEPFQPLLVGIHFHSDLGPNAWVDYSGRRDRESFFANVFQRIEPREDLNIARLAMTSDFEKVFDLFSKLGAPSIEPTADGMNARSLEMSSLFEKYQLKNNPESRLTDVLTVAWACYHEASAVTQTTEQTDLPGRRVGFVQWLTRLFAVALSAGALSVLMPTVQAFVVDQASELSTGAENLMKSVSPAIHEATWPWILWVIVYLLFWLGLRAVVFFSAEAQYMQGNGAGDQFLTRDRRRQLQNSGTRLAGMLFYLPLQALHIAPILVWCILSPLVATWFGALLASGLGWYFSFERTIATMGKGTNAMMVGTLWGFVWTFAALSLLLFSRWGYQSERIDLVKGAKPPIGIRYWPAYLKTFLVWLAILPIRLAKRASRPDQTWVGIWQTIENLLAFWTMAEKATRTGGYVGEAVETIAARSESDAPLRVHLFGHSHGGLVVCNAASWLTRSFRTSESGDANRRHDVCSVATINGAYRSDWFEGQFHVQRGVRGAVASLFSRYDTANSLWYPLANLGRKASGSVGLWLSSPHPPPEIGEPLPSVSVSDARLDSQGRSKLCERLEEVGQCPQQTQFLNVDVSRFVFKGPVLPQGAHGEVYSKDVVATLWRVLQFSSWFERNGKKPGRKEG